MSQRKTDTSQVQLQVQIAKFKFRQYQSTAISPNLMPAKFSRCTVCMNRSQKVTKQLQGRNDITKRLHHPHILCCILLHSISEW